MAPPVAIAASGTASVILNVPAGTKEISRAAAPSNIVAGFLNESWAREEVCVQVTLGWWLLMWLLM